MAFTLSWPHFIALFFIVNIAINLIFASLCLLEPGSVTNVATGSLSDAFYFSPQT